MLQTLIYSIKPNIQLLGATSDIYLDIKHLWTFRRLSVTTKMAITTTGDKMETPLQTIKTL